jgi:hypothetical protein
MGTTVTHRQEIDQNTGKVVNLTDTQTTNSDPSAPDSAYIKKGNKWVKPPKPSGTGVVWVKNQGWKSQASQATEWGYQIGLINSDAGLKSVFQQAWNDELKGAAWDQAKFTNAIQSTNWYKSRTTSQREYDMQLGKGKGSPEYNTLQSKIATQTASVRAAAQQAGVQLSDDEINKIGIEATRNGYSMSELNGIFAKHLEAQKQGVDGFFNSISGTTGVGADKNTILDWAKNNGVTVSDSWVSGQLDQILKGAHDVQKSKDAITSMAKIAYPAHADYLDSRTSVMDRAQTYAQKISSMLEVPYEQVNLSNQHLTDALKPGDDGKPKNLTQVEQELRGTVDWSKTNNAKETTNSVINNVLNKFGLM